MTWTKNTPERFWANVEVSFDEHACWNWKRWRDKGGRGYGHVTWNGKGVLSHRKAWELTYGPIPSGLCVLHSCDNPACCNPSHLHLGTNQENSREAMQRNRVAKGNRNGSRLYPERLMHFHGEQNPAARIPDSTVEEIRRIYIPGQVRQKDVARQFGISQANVSLIVRGKTRSGAS